MFIANSNKILTKIKEFKIKGKLIIANLQFRKKIMKIINNMKIN